MRAARSPDRGSERDAAISWRDPADRGAEPSSPLDPLGDDPPGDAAGDDAAPHGGRHRIRRGRVVLLVAAVLALATAALVTGSRDGDDDEAEPVDEADAVEEAEPADDAGEEAATSLPAVDTLDTGDAGDASSRGGRDGPAIPVDLGLRYGGAGGGADIFASANPIAAPSIDLADAPRLPDTADVAWESVIVEPFEAPTPAELNRSVALAVGADTVVAVVDLRPGHRVVGSTLDGERRWETPLADDRVRLVGVAGDLVALSVGERDEESVRWLGVADGRPVDDPDRIAAALDDLARRRTGATPIPPADVDVDALRAAPGAGAPVTELVDRLVAGDTEVLDADEVAIDRLVLFVAGRLLGVEVDGDELVADWSRPGVLIASSPSDRGATLLVSNLRGSQWQAVDAASGRPLAEVSGLTSSVAVYTAVANGVIVKRTALVGSSLAGLDLDGRERWRILGSRPFAVGERLVVTASVTPEGLVVSGRR